MYVWSQVSCKLNNAAYTKIMIQFAKWRFSQFIMPNTQLDHQKIGQLAS